MKYETLKIKRNNFGADIKSGNKIITKIVSVKDGYVAMSKFFDSIESALLYIKKSREDTAELFGSSLCVSFQEA